MTAELPADRACNVRRRANRARRFPLNTCAASRHVQQLAEALLSRRGCPMLQDDPEHCAVSMLAAVEALWKLRTEAAELKATLRDLHQVCERMDLVQFEKRPTVADKRPAACGRSA
jgi:hypothetical protein